MRSGGSGYQNARMREGCMCGSLFVLGMNACHVMLHHLTGGVEWCRRY